MPSDPATPPTEAVERCDVSHNATAMALPSEMIPTCILLIGIQAAGKSTFAACQFAKTHVILNLDSLRTRARERQVLQQAGPSASKWKDGTDYTKRSINCLLTGRPTD